jgi:tetratricopeptide (TPR) repeat protein
LGCAFWAAALSATYSLRLTENSGAVASGVMVLLPLAAVGVWWQWQCRQPLLGWAGVVAVLMALLGLLATVERTAWLGVTVGLAGAAYLYGRRQPTATALYRLSDAFLALGVISGLLLYVLVLLMPSWDALIHHTTVGRELFERLALWRESLALSRDYYFTGSGLGMTPMIYSTYVLSMHDPYWYHAHNLYLQIAIEQGLPGLLAFLLMNGLLLGIAITAYQKSRRAEGYFWLAAIAALLAALSYGLLDAELYATATVAALFLPLGFVLTLYWAQLQQQHRSDAFVVQPGAALVIGRRAMAGLLPVLALVMLCSGPGVQQRFYTNLGVLTQTKAELSHYHWPAWPLQDELRRKGAVDLTLAHHYYQVVLTLNPANATVHERLGQLALSRGNYREALAHLTQAQEAAPARDSIRRLLGEAYAVTGNVEGAAALWRSVDLQYAQVKDRLWWYEYRKEQQAVQWLHQAFDQQEQKESS